MAFEAVVVGVSAGGVELLLKLVPALPPDFPAPILLCLHSAPGTTADLAQLLGARSRIAVAEAQDKEKPRGGCLYIAPGGYHLHVERDGTLSLSLDAPVKYARPSIDVLFESAARAWGEALVAVVLTGASDDGAAGARAVKHHGGCLVVQDPGTAQVAVMPEAAMRAAAVDRIVEPEALPQLLRELCQPNP